MMRSKSRFLQRWRPVALVLAMTTGLAGALPGCGADVPYTTPQVTSPLNRPGVCTHCQKKIASVTADNLITVYGAQFVVCDERCAEGVKEWQRRLKEE